MKENYPLIENENTLILANFLETQKKTDNPVYSLSFGILDEVQLEDQYRIDYYGHDEDDCVCHVIYHLKRVVNKCQGDQFLLGISVTSSMVNINQLLSQLPEHLGELKRDMHFNHEKGVGMWMFETDLAILKFKHRSCLWPFWYSKCKMSPIGL